MKNITTPENGAGQLSQRIFLGGILLAITVFALISLWQRHLESRLAERVSRCSSEEPAPGLKRVKGMKPWEKYQRKGEAERPRVILRDDMDGLVCSPEELIAIDSRASAESDYRTLSGIQGEIILAKESIAAWQDVPGLLAVFMLLLSSLPFAWYFCLERIAEVRRAVLGR